MSSPNSSSASFIFCFFSLNLVGHNQDSFHIPTFATVAGGTSFLLFSYKNKASSLTRDLNWLESPSAKCPIESRSMSFSLSCVALSSLEASDCLHCHWSCESGKIKSSDPHLEKTASSQYVVKQKRELWEDPEAWVLQCPTSGPRTTQRPFLIAPSHKLRFRL